MSATGAGGLPVTPPRVRCKLGTILASVVHYWQLLRPVVGQRRVEALGDHEFLVFSLGAWVLGCLAPNAGSFHVGLVSTQHLKPSLVLAVQCLHICASAVPSTSRGPVSACVFVLVSVCLCPASLTSPSSIPSKHHFSQSTSEAVAPFPRIHAMAMHQPPHGCTHLLHLLQPSHHRVQLLHKLIHPYIAVSPNYYARPSQLITIDGSTSRIQYYPLNYGLEARAHRDGPASRSWPYALVPIVSPSLGSSSPLPRRLSSPSNDVET